MRRIIIIAAAVVAALVVFVGVILFYAATNLNSIIAERRQTILDKASTALGRQVHVTDIKVSLGWGIMADLTGVQVADDPDISKKPFLEASNVYAKLELMPLLARRIEVTEVVLDKPVFRIIQTRDGKYNVSSIGAKKEGENAPEAAAPKEKAEGGAKKSTLSALLVKDFTVNDGTVILSNEGATGAGATFNSIDLKLRNFGFNQPFTVALTFAALSDKQNFDLSATVGPLMKNGAIDVNAIPLSAKASIGPLALARLKTIPMLAKALPPQLSIPDPVSLEASADGTVDSIKFNVTSDLSSNAIAFGDAFAKPANLPLKISAQGSRTGSIIDVKLAQITLGDLEMKATNIKVGGATTSARVDTNSFDLASLAKILPALGKYSASGKSEIHADVLIARGKPSAKGTVSLTEVGMSQGNQQTPALSHLTGNIRLAGTSADVGPMNFNLGPAQATLSAHVDQFQPLVSSYELKAAAIRLADFAPARPPQEQINQLFAKGALSIQPIGPVLDSTVTSVSGNVAGVEYQNLNLSVSLEGKRARVVSMKLGAFAGEVVATASTTLEAGAPFAASVSFSNLDVQKALEAQKAKAAGIVRGSLGGNLNVSGKSGAFDEMKPTLKGDGKLMLTNGKLVGVNLGGETLKKVQNLPAIGDLVPANIISRHPELFSNPDTDIQIASLTFVLAGPRITSHDIKAQTVDYNLLGDGWFDMDKNIDLAARIVLSQPFSAELIAAKKNVSYIANRDGQIDIPLQITGQLPKPSVLPNVTELAQRAGTHAVQEQGQKYIGKFLGKKGLPGGLGGSLGGLLGGGAPAGDSGGGAGAGGSGAGAPPPSGGSKPPPNPLDQLKKLF